MKKLIALIAAFAIFSAQSAVFAADTDTISDFTAAAVTASPVPSESAEDTSENVSDYETSVEYKAYEQISQYIADRYLDASYTGEDIMKIGISEYLKKNGDAALVDVLKAALQSLDDYSDFYTYEEYVEYNNELNRTFYGLGITMQQSGEYVEITGFVEENGLAQKSGFMQGDKIIKVNGINVVGSSTTEVRNLVIGELGTTVPITVLRDGKEVELIGTRTAVNSSTVSGGILDGNIGYIKISNFSTGTAAEFTELKNMFIENGVKKLILDLRNNPGGLVSSAVAIAQQIVPKGKIVDVKYRDETLNQTFESQMTSLPFRIVTLVNGNTASSSEILASAIQDSKVGILMGEQTFGKGIIQSTYSLRNGMAFKLTIGQYLTRNGNEIHQIGLAPDKEVSNYKKKIDTTGYTKFDFLTPVSAGGSGTNVTAAKERLSVMGYYIGNLGNDVFNTDLTEAIKEFQRDNNLTDSGALDVATQIKLKAVFETLETTVDIQLQEAYKYFGGDVDALYN